MTAQRIKRFCFPLLQWYPHRHRNILAHRTRSFRDVLLLNQRAPFVVETAFFFGYRDKNINSAIYKHNNHHHTRIYIYIYYNVIVDAELIILLPSLADSGEKCFVSPTNKSSNCDVDHNGVFSASSSGVNEELKDPSTDSSCEAELRLPRDPLTALVTAGLITFAFERCFVVMLLFEVEGEADRGTCEGFKSTT